MCVCVGACVRARVQDGAVPMLGAKGVQLGGIIRPGESCHDGRVHPSTGGQLHRETTAELAKTWNLGRPPSSVRLMRGESPGGRASKEARGMTDRL